MFQLVRNRYCWFVFILCCSFSSVADVNLNVNEENEEFHIYIINLGTENVTIDLNLCLIMGNISFEQLDKKLEKISPLTVKAHYSENCRGSGKQVLTPGEFRGRVVDKGIMRFLYGIDEASEKTLRAKYCYGTEIECMYSKEFLL